MNSGPIEITRPRKTTQRVYSSEIIEECKELFGDDSIEYGLAIAGLPNLIKLLDTHLLRFSPEAVVKVANDDSHKDGIVAAAERAIRIADLKRNAEPAAGRASTPSWFS